jgi:hypothetical protein
MPHRCCIYCLSSDCYKGYFFSRRAMKLDAAREAALMQYHTTATGRELG